MLKFFAPISIIFDIGTWQTSAITVQCAVRTCLARRFMSSRRNELERGLSMRHQQDHRATSDGADILRLDEDESEDGSRPLTPPLRSEDGSCPSTPPLPSSAPLHDPEHGTSERGQYDKRVREDIRHLEEEKRKGEEETSKSRAKEEESTYETEKFEEEEVVVMPGREDLRKDHDGEVSVICCIFDSSNSSFVFGFSFGLI